MKSADSGCIHLKHPGIFNAFELAMRFHLWASELRREPTWQEVCERFDVSRATAYRWLSGYRAAIGVSAR